MKRITKLSTCLLALTMLPLSFIGCNTTPSTPPTTETPSTALSIGEDYVITCPSDEKTVSLISRTIKYAFRDEIGIRKK